MRFLKFLVLTALISCKNESGKPISGTKEQELKTFVIENFKQTDTTIKLDSFRFIRIDTITEKAKFVLRNEELKEEMNNLYDQIEQLSEKARLELQMMRVSRGVLESTYQNAKEDAKKYIEEADILSKQGEEVQKQMDSLKLLHMKADSVKPIALQAVCLYQIKRKDNSILRDTAFVIMDNSFNIIRREDFFKVIK